MATLIQAVSAYRPRVLTNRVVDLEELATRLARGSLVTPSIARMVLSDLADELMYFLRTGASVRLPGIGVFRPELRIDGEMHTVIRMDPKLRRNLAHVNDFVGEVEGREAIGVDVAAIKARWDAEHPDDPVVLPLGGSVRVAAIADAGPATTASEPARSAAGSARSRGAVAVADAEASDEASDEARDEASDGNG